MIVVGKGGSYGGRGLGEKIDSHYPVIRLTNGRIDKDFGFRMDYVLAIALETDCLKEYDLTNTKELWLYETNGKWKGIADIKTHKIFINGCIEKWLNKYREIAKPLRPHPNVDFPTKGTAAIFMALETFKLTELYLAGMDKVMLGKRTYHCHDHRAEKQVINEAAETHKCRISILS